MTTLARTCAAALMLSCMAGNVMAAAEAGCARPNDMAAVKTAAIQQRLMVAALTCHATPRYNSFVLAYQKELQASDRALQNFFQRLKGKTGTEEYHAFKTRLANASSMASIRDITGYCSSADQLFDDALNSTNVTLAAFVGTRETAADTAFEPCGAITTGGKGTTPPAIRNQHKKAVNDVLPAQGGGLTAPE